MKIDIPYKIGDEIDIDGRKEIIIGLHCFVDRNGELSNIRAYVGGKALHYALPKNKEKGCENMKCKVCERRFNPRTEDLYLAQEHLSPLAALTTTAKIYECFDCPHCGCQNFVNIRIPKVEGEAYDREEQEEIPEQ